MQQHTATAAVQHGTCDNCGETRQVATYPGVRVLCAPCIDAERAYCRQHFTAEEFDSTALDAMSAALDGGTR